MEKYFCGENALEIRKQKSEQNLVKTVISCVAVILKHGCSPFSSALVGTSWSNVVKSEAHTSSNVTG